MPIINTLNEKPLHASLKKWCSRPGDLVEEKVGGYLIDLVRDDLLIEIQTRSFGALKRKLARLLEEHRVRLVYPVPREKWIVRLDTDGETVLGRRKSPKRGGWWTVFEELVSIPHLVTHENFSLEVLLIQEEEARHYRAGRVWRRKGWATAERRLVSVVESRVFDTPWDLLALVPETLEEPFCTGAMALASGQPRRLAQKAAYCLRGCGALRQVGKKGNAWSYCRCAPEA